jgi:hypothetical protein
MKINRELSDARLEIAALRVALNNCAEFIADNYQQCGYATRPPVLLEAHALLILPPKGDA